jgi:CRISPR type III-A-associated protein Csm2
MPPQVESRWNDMALRQRWLERYRLGYFHEGHLKEEFVRRVEIEPLVEELSRGTLFDSRRFPALTTHQLRRFFGHSRLIERELRVRKKTWAEIRPAFLKLDGSAQDAFGKHEPKIPVSFQEFIEWNVAAVKTERDFLDGFLPHFEAIVGFSSGKLKDR